MDELCTNDFFTGTRDSLIEGYMSSFFPAVLSKEAGTWIFSFARAHSMLIEKQSGVATTLPPAQVGLLARLVVAPYRERRGGGAGCWRIYLPVYAADSDVWSEHIGLR